MARILSVLMAAAAAAACFASMRTTFIPPRFPSAGHSNIDARTMGALVGTGVALPVFAEGVAAAKIEEAAAAKVEEVAGRIPLGGGFAINLDIPETGLVNIVVLIAGLLYLLAPLLSESMATREKEIQTDIDDAIAKYQEATARLAEAQKAKAQADEVIAEIEASISKDQQEFQTMIDAQTTATLEKQAAASEAALKELEASADLKVDAYIQEQAVKQGLTELQQLSGDQKAKFMDAAINSL